MRAWRIWTCLVGGILTPSAICVCAWTDEVSGPPATPEVRDRAVQPPNDKGEPEAADNDTPANRENLATDTAAKLESAARRCKQAADAMQLYEEFLHDPKVSDAEKKLAEPRFAFWKDAAEKKLVRVGARLVAPDERENLRHQAKLLVTNAWDLVGIGSDDAARDKLILASRTYPDAIEADFTLGLLNALAAHHAPTAEKHFAVCVRRMPHHVSALNNLALAEVRQKKYGQALGHWRTALQLAPGTNEIAHNIGRVLRYSGSSVIRVPKDIENALSDLYVNTTALPGVAKSDENIGWLYMPLFALDDAIVAPGDVANDAVLPKAPGAKGAGQRIVAGSGSGVVVGHGFLVTTHQLVEHADGFQVVHPESLQRLPATLLAVSKAHNLAVLNCPQLVAPALKVANVPPRLGTDVMVLGYARDAPGIDLRAKRGAVSSVATVQRPYCLLDAAVSAGSDGGAVLDESGSIVGLISAFADESRSSESRAIPSNLVVDFARPLVKDLAVKAAGDAANVKWQDVAALGSKSTVLVLVERNPINFAMKNAHVERPARLNASAYEDETCIRCNGVGTSECPRAGCALGKVLVPRREDGQFKNVREPCPTCDGRGKVACPICAGSGKG